MRFTATVEGRAADAPYLHTVSSGSHRWVTDEPPALGGADAGPAPYPLLLASLGSFTAITLRMYAERKGWPLGDVRVELTYTKRRAADGGGDGADGELVERIDREITLGGDLDDEQVARLLDISERTPVTLTLKGGVAIHTRRA